jgi:hypothetical protein
MRFHVNFNETKIYIGFYAKNYRFVFYTHGKIYEVETWKKFIQDNKLVIYDEDDNQLDWIDFMKFVDHLQYNSNARWANGFFVSNGREGYNFSNNRGQKQGA